MQAAPQEALTPEEWRARLLELARRLRGLEDPFLRQDNSDTPGDCRRLRLLARPLPCRPLMPCRPASTRTPEQTLRAWVAQLLSTQQPAASVSL